MSPWPSGQDHAFDVGPEAEQKTKSPGHGTWYPVDPRKRVPIDTPVAPLKR